MPAFVKTKEDEKAWQKAKGIVARQRKKSEDAFEDRDWALTNHIYQNIVRSNVEHAIERGDVKVLLAQVENILLARKNKKKKDGDLPEDVRILVEALSMVMAQGGQTIAALRSKKKTGMKLEEAQELANRLQGTAKTVGKLLEKLKG